MPDDDRPDTRPHVREAAQRPLRERGYAASTVREPVEGAAPLVGRLVRLSRISVPLGAGDEVLGVVRAARA